MSDYNYHKNRIRNSITLGIDVEKKAHSDMGVESAHIPDLTNEQINWLSSWLAGESFVWQPGLKEPNPKQLVLTRKGAFRVGWTLIKMASGTPKVGIAITKDHFEIAGADYVRED